MTEIVLLMWMADVLGSVKIVSIIVSILIGVFVLVIVINEYEETDKIRKLKYAWWMAIPMSIALVIPDSKTIYMLAAARAASSAAATPIGQKVMDAIERKLDEVIKEKTK